MFTDTTYFDIFYDEPCDPVNQLPTMSAATGISGSFVSGGINYRWHSISVNSLGVIPGQNTVYCPNSFSTIFTVENMGNICSVQLLLVGGGGGGGLGTGGGGGGGQVVYVPNFPIRPGKYCCSRGAAGTGNQSGANSGSNGGDSTLKLLYPDISGSLFNDKNIDGPIFTITARGGGGGGTDGFNSGSAGSKGTGGGAAKSGLSGSALFSTSIYYNGKNGGLGAFAGGGGGGAATTGSNASSTGGNGGAGIGPLYMTGSTGEYYGGGGGGGNDEFNIKGFGGIGGGGDGAGLRDFISNPNPATTGTDFLGGGGGGGGKIGFAGQNGANGGRGTVIITYKYQLD